MTEVKDKTTTTNGVSRREFIAGTVGGVVVGAVVGAAAGSLGFPKTVTKMETTTQTTTSVTTAQPWLPAKWDQTADIVVVGYGGAGAVAAIEAHNKGANVLLLEKMAEGMEGGNTACSLGVIFTPSPAADAVTYLNAMSEGYPIPQDMVQVWAQQMGQNANWLTSIGGTPVNTDKTTAAPYCPEYPELPGADCAHAYGDGAAPSFGVNHFAFLESVVQKLGITVMYQTPATGLIQNPETNEILGVQATSNGSTINVKASKAVILTLGGFESNPQMLRDYAQLENGGPLGTPANTGDGIVMAKKAGAALWHMDNISGAGMGMILNAGPNVSGFILGLAATGYIYIGSDGNRFVNETIANRHGKIPFNYQVYPKPTATTAWVPFPTPCPMHAIFDDTTRKAGPISYTSPSAGVLWNCVHNTYSWSNDNSAEIAKGWIQQGDTLQDLAPKINRDPTQLSNVVAQWSTLCQQGADPQFGRAKSTLTPIVTPPFYGVELSWLMVNTQGGAKRNTKAQIVDDNDNPIPRLYSAGEFGSMYSWAYNGGGNLGESIAFGVIAADNAATETPWS